MYINFLFKYIIALDKLDRLTVISKITGILYMLRIYDFGLFFEIDNKLPSSVNYRHHSVTIIIQLPSSFSYHHHSVTIIIQLPSSFSYRHHLVTVILQLPSSISYHLHSVTIISYRHQSIPIISFNYRHHSITVISYRHQSLTVIILCLSYESQARKQ